MVYFISEDSRITPFTPIKIFCINQQIKITINTIFNVSSNNIFYFIWISNNQHLHKTFSMMMKNNILENSQNSIKTVIKTTNIMISCFNKSLVWPILSHTSSNNSNMTIITTLLCQEKCSL